MARRADPLARLQGICLAFPEVIERPSHGAPTFFVRGKKSFVMFHDDHHGDGILGIWCAAPPGAQAELIAASAPLIQPRIAILAEAPGMLGFLFVGEAEFTVDPDDAARALTVDAEPVLTAAEAALADLEPWTCEAIDAALRAALVDGLGLKPRAAFSGALRVAVTGKRAGPPLFESIALLGRERTLGRLARARVIVAGGGQPGE